MKQLKQILVFLKANKYSVACVMIILLNPWWWIIIQRNFWIGILIFTLSILVIIFFQNKSQIFLPLLVLTGILIIVNLRQAYDESILRLSDLEIQQYNRRHEFYANDLGKIYTNRFSLSYFKNYHLPLFELQRNFFGNLDLNLFFFASHPRERVGVEEFEKYLPVFLPFFVIGFVYLIFKPIPKFILYLTIILLISSLISPYYNLGPVLLFSIINFIISLGFLLSLKFIHRSTKNDF